MLNDSYSYTSARKRSTGKASKTSQHDDERNTGPTEGRARGFTQDGADNQTKNDLGVNGSQKALSQGSRLYDEASFKLDEPGHMGSISLGSAKEAISKSCTARYYTLIALLA